MNPKENKIKFLLFLLGWKEVKEKDEKIHGHKTWINDEDQVIWYVNYPNDTAKPYYLFCKSKKDLYREDWINLSSVDNPEKFLGEINEPQPKPKTTIRI